MRLALRAARLFDGARAELLERPLLLIEDGRITGVESGEIELPDGTNWSTWATPRCCPD